jgi:hypothetical protein
MSAGGGAGPDHRGGLRASDAEREAVADRLRGAAAEGRLDPEELDERLGRAYAARTHAELDALTADLPAATALPARGVRSPGAPVDGRAGPVPDVLPPGRWTPGELRERAAGFLIPNLICIAIWLATGAESNFWPGWVLLFTAIGVLASFIRGPDAERRRHRDRGRSDINR